MGKLIVVPTPIGNLKDLSERVIEVLTTADVIACEDTRTTGRLLKHIGSLVNTISYHMHNEEFRSEGILELLKEGKTVALVSDAGMPGISDPGHVLINKAITDGHQVSVIPGPSAFITALVGSGLPTDRFTFIGFLDKNRTKRRKELNEIKDKTETIILYEAPHRLREFLELLLEVMGDRKIVLARELSKVYEEYERGSISEIIEIYKEKEPRGEYVIILEGKSLEKLHEEEQEKLSEITIEEHVKGLMDEGLSKMDAVKRAAKERGLKKNEVYMLVNHL
ncbi:MAG: 16S rRNA (cytidine(1402)-2'-O)-methyltransferase [Clostridiaceae bacterium]